ncbi:MAG: CvpA family protein, partial [Proteobacteria bacterium]|nr:CvpA family protein [Pseudomonadota bacterium]
MNQVDFFILVVVAACALSGARRGLISSAGDIVTLVVGLGVGSLAYPIVDFPLRWFGLPPTVSGPIGFSLVAVAAVVLVGWGIS